MPDGEAWSAYRHICFTTRIRWPLDGEDIQDGGTNSTNRRSTNGNPEGQEWEAPKESSAESLAASNVCTNTAGEMRLPLIDRASIPRITTAAVALATGTV